MSSTCTALLFRVLAITLIAAASPRATAQADLENTGEFSAYAGGAFGIGSHAAVGGASAFITHYALLAFEVAYTPLGNSTLRNTPVQLATHSGLLDVSTVVHVRIPLRSRFEPYGIVGGGWLRNLYDVPKSTGDITTSFRRTDDNFGFHTGAGVRYYVRPELGVRGECRITISNQVFSRVSAGVFFQF